jgi:hypothetical protein
METIEKTEALAPHQPRAMDLLSLALQNNAAIDVIERLAAIQRDEREWEAKIAFNEAMNHVQADIKRVAPDLENPQTRSKYATYAALDRTVRPIYSKAGFSLSFNTTDCPIPEHVRVICYVSLGAHTREYQVDMPADGKGAKGGDVMTKTHAAGAAMSYGMRYLLKGIFNIAVGAEDTDGNMGELLEAVEWIENASNKDELNRLYKQAYEKFEASPAALRAVIEARKKKAKEF